MLTKFKAIPKIFRLYYKELLFLNIYISLILSLFYFQMLNLFTFIFIVFLSSVVIIYFFDKTRKNEIKKIVHIIENIRENKIKTSDGINLGENLFTLEKSIKRMFEKSKNDIDYMNKLQRIRSEFIGNVSHELRTPIFAIQGYIETLLNGAIDDPRVNKNFLNKALQHTSNLNNLLEDLINISMIESGQMQMSFRYFNLNPYLQSIVEEFHHLAEEKNLKLILNLSSNNLFVLGDKERLKQVFNNLISNAIKYTDKGQIEIIAEKDKKSIKVTIKDTGIGIPESDIDRIFERFYRVDKARSRAVGGTGLGLSIVKHILEAHNSKISVKSKLGEGSEFTFSLKT